MIIVSHKKIFFHTYNQYRIMLLVVCHIKNFYFHTYNQYRIMLIFLRLSNY